MRRPLVKILTAAGLALLATDLALTLFVLDDGTFGWRPVPPLGAVSSAPQRDWLAGQIDELEGRRGPGLIGLFDAELGWCNPRSKRGGPRDPIQYAYELHGARSERDYADAPASGVVRLSCYGESFTHGDEVSNADTWQLQLEALDPGYEALNFGVGGYGTDQALLRFRREGLHGARVACIGYMLENIGRNANRYRPLWYPTTIACGAKPRFVLRDGELELVPLPYATRADLIDAIQSGAVIDDLAEHEHWNAEAHMQWLRFSGIARLAAGWWTYRRRLVSGLYDDATAEPYRVTLALLETFVREAEQRGAQRALVLVLPREGDLAEIESRGEPYWTSFVAELRSRGVDVLDVSDALLAAWRDARANRTLAPLFAGGHYSRAGNGVIARELHEWLAANVRTPGVNR